MDEAVLAASDTLVLAALTRAWQRSAGRDRWDVPPRDRHRAYEVRPVPEDKIDTAMQDAWHLLPVLVSHLDLDVDWTKWRDALDGYTRALLMSGMPHTIQRLSAALTLVDLTVPEWEDEDEALPVAVSR